MLANKNMNTKIGVIIVSFNSRQYLDDLFFSLGKVRYPNWEIVFIDNGSQDGSADYAKEKFASGFPNLTIIKIDKNSGFAIGNNIGLRYLAENHFDYGYLLNQDTEVAPDFLEKALAKAGDGVGSAQSLVLLHSSVIPVPYQSTGQAPAGIQGHPVKSGEAGARSSEQFNRVNSLGNAIHYLGFGYCYGYGWEKEKWEKYLADWKKKDAELNIAYGSGAGLLLDIRALKNVGFFDESYFMYHEDLDLGWRLRLAGYKNVLAPESVIYHKYEFGKSIKKYYWMERNRFITIFKNYSAWVLILIFPALFAMELGLFFFSFFSGWWREKLRVYEYFLEIKNWKIILEKRRQAQALRSFRCHSRSGGNPASDKEISKYFVGKILFQDMDNWVLQKIANPIFNLYWLIIKILI
jgi:GT2 family glycosyltransferase